MKTPSKRIVGLGTHVLTKLNREGRTKNQDLNPINLNILLLVVCRKHKLVCFLLSFLFLSLSTYAFNDGNRYAKNSVLAKGNWFKIKIPTTGVYKLTYEDLKQMGLSNPKDVQIYGYGGWMLDQDFSTPYIDDLPPVSVWMSKNPQDFGPGDYILFYGRGDIKWKYDSNTKEFIQTQNPYSSDSYYFITESTDGPQLIEKRKGSPLGRNEITSFQDYYLHEKELVNISLSGREFYGESFIKNTQQTFSISLPGITQDIATVRYNFIAKPKAKVGKLAVMLNNTLMKTSTISAVSINDSYTKANILHDYFTSSITQEDNKLTLNYIPATDTDENMHLNFFCITYTKALKPYGAITPFRITESISSVDFKIADAHSNLLILDVNNANSPVEIDGQLSGNSYKFSANNSSIKEYVIVDLSREIPTPTFSGKVANQNLHASAATEMVIIVQPLFKKYAEELAETHKDDSNLKTLIVSPEDIYNEFSSGKPDATAYRRFLKMFYDRATSESEKPRYLLLFGDASYDNRFITKEWNKSDKRGILLSYQSVKSTDETTSYVTDDYFGFLDDNEGTSIEKDKLDIGIGRIPVRTTFEAETVVAKIKRYIRNEEPGIWQNSICFVADDAIASTTSTISEADHMKDTDSYAEYLKENKPEFISTKVYQDAYDRFLTPKGGGIYPDAKKAMLDKINSGALILNYVGHGSSRDWSHEYILTYPDIEAMRNTKLPLWVTATCDFSRFDGSSTSGGEAALLNPNGGAIALFTTVRVVYATMNKKLSQSLFSHIFEKEDGKPLRLGDIMRRTKTLDTQLASDENKLRFVLLGDPALRLSYPGSQYKVIVDKVNDIDITSNKVQIQALENITVKGRIVNEGGQLASDFNGMLESLMFDNEQGLKTRGYVNYNQRPPYPSSEEIALKYKDYTNTIFSGKSSIVNGEFEIAFVTPMDILYTEGMGRMNFYAYDTDGIKNAQGVFNNYTVGGTSNSAIQEFNSPIIEKIYLDNEQFKSGDKVSPSPLFYAQLSDDTGINLANGIGHNISIMIDGKTPYDLTPTFVNSGTSSKKGTVKYKIPTLEVGKHTLQFKAWDVWNNSTTKHLEFKISDDDSPTPYNFSIENNTVKDNAKFVFTCDGPVSTAINIKYEVYSENGSLKWSHETKGSPELLSNYIYEWNLRGVSGKRLTAGVYTCRILITINGEESSETHKMVILAQ